MFYCNLFLCLRGSAANAYSFRHEEVFVPPRRNLCSITGYILFHMVEQINIGNAPF